MLGEVEVAAIMNPFQLAPAERVLVLDIERGARIVRQLLRAMLMKPQVLQSDAKAEIPVEACFPPMLEPLHGGVGFDEELHLHLLELTGAKDEVAWGDFIAEGFADLGDAEGDFLARWLLYITKIDVAPLRGFRPQVDACPLFLHGANVGLKHQIEQPRFGQLAWTSRRARGDARLARTGRLSHLIGAKPLLAEFTIHHRIAEPGDVARSLPHPWVHQNGGVEPLDVIAVPGHAPPPPRLDIVLQLDAERPIVPATVNAPVDLAGRENEATTLAERHKLVHHIATLECLGWLR